MILMIEPYYKVLILKVDMFSSEIVQECNCRSMEDARKFAQSFSQDYRKMIVKI